jgi:hypothetical protein
MSALGHLRRGHVEGMSAIAPNATEFLNCSDQRNGPITDKGICAVHTL